MKITQITQVDKTSNRISFYQNHRPHKESFDNFSILDKYNEEYKYLFLKDIIPDLKEFLKKNNIIKERDIKNIIGDEGLSIIFDIGNNEVLKCSLENPLEFRKHNSEFDIPFLSPVYKENKTYIVKEAKAETKNIKPTDCKQVIKKIKKAGFDVTVDLRESKTQQIGIYKGKLYLLDTRCAIPKPDKFSQFVYNFCKRHKLFNMVREMSPDAIKEYDAKIMNQVKEFGPQILHTEEIPKKNLTLIEGFKMIYSLMKENIKHKRFPL